MGPDHEATLLHLLTGQRLLALSVLVAGRPYVGLLPFAVWPEREALVVAASDLARHAKGLAPGAPWAGLLHRPDRPDADPRRLPRVTLEGGVGRVDRSDPRWPAALEVYLRRFPESRGLFSLGDFRLYELGIARGRFFADFAATFNLAPGLLGRLAEGG